MNENNSFSREGFFIISLEGYFIDLSDATVELFGYNSEEELRRVRMDELYADLEERKRHLKEINRLGSTKNYPVNLRKKDGTVINTLISTVIRKDITGSIIGYQGTIRDITVQKRAQEALRESESKYRLLIEHSFDMIWNMTAEGVFTYVSPSWEKITGYTSSLIVGLSFESIVHPDYVDACFKYLQFGIQSKDGSQNPEYLIKYADDTWHWHSATAIPVLDQDGKFVSFLGISWDITEQKQAEEVLAQERERLAIIIEGTNVGTWECNIQTGAIIFNQRWAQIIGYTHEELAPANINTWMKLIHPDDLKRSKELMETHLRGELDIFDCELRMRHKNGTWVWVRSRGRVLKRSDSGNPLTIFGTCTDITERKQAEKSREELQRYLEQVMEHLPDPTCVINRQGQVVFWNKAIEEMTGIPKEQIIGKGNYEYGVPFHGEPHPCLIDCALMSDNEYDELKKKYNFIHKQGNTLVAEYFTSHLYNGKGTYLSLSASKLYDLHGNTIGAIETLRDVTERKKAEIALALEKQNLDITLESIGDGVISTDSQGKIQLLNKVATQLTGWTQKEAYNKPFAEVFNIIDEFSRRKQNPVRKVLNAGNIIELNKNTILISKEGLEIFCEGSVSPIKDENNHVNGVVLVFRDITEEKERQEKIYNLSYRDPLTGLHNRRFYEEELSRLDIENNLPLTLIMADVNGLKLVNDAFGHLEGDKLLKRAAEVMKKECRTGDIIARIGGDEFVLLLPKTDSEQAATIVRRINETILKEKLNSGILSISFGCKTKKEAAEDIDKVFKEAEDEMYRHKLSESASIRNRVIQAIIKTLYEKNNREQKHSVRTSLLCQAIGEALGLNREDISELRIAGLLHDIGKIALDSRILDKPDTLSDSEWLDIKLHTEIGYHILSPINELSQLAESILAHHERWDGKGYPKGLKGEQIPLKARIISVADAYDAMISYRPYRKALSKNDAIKELERNAGTQFDPDIVRIFIEKIYL